MMLFSKVSSPLSAKHANQRYKIWPEIDTDVIYIQLLSRVEDVRGTVQRECFIIAVFERKRVH